MTLRHVLVAHRDPVYSLEKSIQELCFYTGGGDGIVLKWSLKNPDKATAIAKTDSSVYVIKELPNGLLLIGNNDGFIYLINPNEKVVLAENKLEYTIFDWYVAPGKGLVYAALANGHLSILSIDDLQVKDTKQVARGHLRIVQKDPTSETLLIGSSDHSIYGYDMQKESFHILRRDAHVDSVFSLHAVSRDQIVSGGKDAYLRLWYKEKGHLDLNEETAIPAHLLTINQIIEHPSLPLLATAGRDKTIKIWDKESLLLRKVIDRTKFENGPTHSVNRIAFLNDNHLVSVGDDKAVRIWELTF